MTNHVKINFVGAFTSISVSGETTASDVIDMLLDRNEIPVQYNPICALLEIREDKFGYPLKPETNMNKFVKSQNTLHFRVLSIPLELKAYDLDANFLNLLHNQVHRLIITRTWATEDDVIFSIAGHRAGIEFGLFNASQHKVGMFSKVLEQYVSADIIQAMKQKDIEARILQEWAAATEAGKCQNHNAAVRNYLAYVQDNVAQYGCATFVSKLLKINQEVHNQYIYFSIRQSGYLMLDADGQEIATFGFDSVSFQEPGPGDNKLGITVTNTNKTFHVEMNGIHAMLQVAEFLKTAKLEL